MDNAPGQPYEHGKAYVFDSTSQTFDPLVTPAPNPFQDIVDFHVKFDLVYDGKPRHLPEDLESFRVGFMAEELAEYTTEDHVAQNRIINAAQQGTRIRPFDMPPSKEKQLDALVDLMYVLLGNAYLQGFPIAEAWRRVHAANMKKVRTTRTIDSKRGSLYDVIKPAGWSPPDLTDLV